MSNLFRLFIFTSTFFFSMAALAQDKWVCTGDYEGEVKIKIVYTDQLIGDILTWRRLRLVSLQTEGETLFEKKYLLGKTLGGESVALGSGYTIAVTSGAAQLTGPAGNTWDIPCDLVE